ncbi:unnamed protein product [Meganyctiphanes norvegica]|uniref:Transient receptor potential cation channel subfamily A member 1 n=1 Tax=Meganyctiphanes norvegica TaxID=48144 RepID=A0AAV2QE95_MEGNR
MSATILELLKRATAEKDEEITRQAQDILAANPEVRGVVTEDHDTLLHLAAQKNLRNVVELLLDEGADIDAQNNDSETPLHLTIKNYAHNSFRVLIERGANLNIQNKDHLSALHLAIERRYKDMVEVLLMKGADLNIKSAMNYTPIHTASNDGDKVIMKLLLEKSSESINNLTSNGLYPLHIAAKKGHAECCEMLLSHGSLINALNEEDMSALHFAVKYGFVHTCNVLISHSADVDKEDNTRMTPLTYAAACKSKDSVEILELLLKNNPDVNRIDKNGLTALHYVIKNTDLYNDELFSNKVLMLMNAGADCTLKDNDMKTPLHYASKKNLPYCCSKILKLNFSQEEYTDLQTLSPQQKSAQVANEEQVFKVNDIDNDGNAPIHYALKNSSRYCCELLLKRRANPNIPDKNGNVPLHLACITKLDNCCRRLIVKGAHVNEKNNSGETPLHIAAKYGFLVCCRILLKHGAKLNLQDSNNLTPLHNASKRGACDVVSLLLDSNSWPLIIDKGGRNPLHWAARHGHLDCCKELIGTSGIVELLFQKDNEGYLPLHHAFYNKHDSVFVFLISSPADDPKYLWKKATHTITAAFHLNRGAAKEVRDKYRLVKPLNLSKYDEEEYDDAIDDFEDLTSTDVDNLDYTGVNLNAVMSYSELGDLGIKEILAASIKENRQIAAEAIIKSKCWEQALAHSTGTDPNNNFCLLISKYPQLAKIALDKCIHADGKGGMTYDFFYLDNTFHRTEELQSEDGHTEHTESKKDILEKTGLRKLWNMFWDILLVQIILSWIFHFLFCPSEHERSTSKDSYRRGGAPSWSPYNNDGSLLPQAAKTLNDECLWRREHPLILMANNERLDLLEHPLSLRFLNYKWKKYVERIFAGLLIMALLYAVLLSAYAVQASCWEDIQNSHNISREVLCNHGSPHSSYSSLARGKDSESCSYRGNQDPAEYTCNSNFRRRSIITELHMESPSFIGGLAFFILALSIILEFNHTSHLWHNFRHEAVVRAVCYVTSIAFLVDWSECANQTGIREDWQWTSGALAVLLAWFHLVLLLGLTPQFSVYLLLINDFLKTLLKLLMLLFLLVLAFAFPFHMLMRGTFAFSKWSVAIMKTFMMVLGDVGYDDLFNNEENPLPYPIFTHLLLLLFLILMSVVTINLVTNFPQDALDKAKEQTQLIKRTHWVKMILTIESTLPTLRRHYTVGWITDYDSNTSDDNGDSNITAFGIEESTEDEELESNSREDISELKEMIEVLGERLNELSEKIVEQKQ